MTDRLSRSFCRQGIRIRWMLLFATSFIVIAVCGCSSPTAGIRSARTAFATGDIVTAREVLDDLSDQDNRFSDAAALDLAIAELAARDFRGAEQRLRTLRDRFDSLPKITPVHEATSIITDDTARVFRPAGYEQVMIRAMLSICSLAGDASDAESYSLQAAMRQHELSMDAEKRGINNVADVYQPIALTPYLQGMLREATHHDYDDATRAYQLVSALRPDFVPAAADVSRASGGTHSMPGNGVLYVIACVGRGPVLEETVAPTTSAALQIASAVLNVETNDDRDSSDHRRRRNRSGRALALPNIASVKVPCVVVPPSEIAALGIRVDGQLLGATQTLTAVNELAANQAAAEMPWTIARAVIRRATKESAVAQAGKSLGVSGTLGSLFHFAVTSAWSGVEHADTRCWGLLPREIQVLRAELPKGTYGIQLQPLGVAGEPIADGNRCTVDIIDGQNRYLIAIAPDRAVYLVD